MEPYRRQPKAEPADDEANIDEHRPHDSHQQDQSSGPAYFSDDRHHYQYYQHHYYPPPPPPYSHSYNHYHYPPHYHHYAAPPVPTPWHASSRSAPVPVTEEVKPRQDVDDDDERKRPASLHSRNDSEGSRKLDPYEPIPWNEAQAQPMLVTSEAQARANRVLPAVTKNSPPHTLKSPPEEPARHYDSREAGSFSPIEVSSAHLAGSQYEKADSIWDIRYKELTAFKLKYGHCNVPQKWQANKSLGIWVNKQRMEYNKRIDGERKSSLNDSRLERLHSIGFRWAKRKGLASWENHFDALVSYKEEFGHCSVPTKYKEDTALGRWVSTQRAEYKKYSEGDLSAMTIDKIRRLEAVGFAWWMGV